MTYDLDDIGFVGTQKPISNEERAKDDALVSAFMRKKKTERTEDEQREIDIYTAQIRAGFAAKEAKAAQQHAYEMAMEFFRLRAYDEVKKKTAAVYA